MTHFYKRAYGFRNRWPRQEQHESFKILCMEGRLPLERLGERPTSVPHNATCPLCLNILIPKKENELAKMIANRNANLTVTPSSLPDNVVPIQGGQ